MEGLLFSPPTLRVLELLWQKNQELAIFLGPWATKIFLFYKKSGIFSEKKLTT